MKKIIALFTCMIIIISFSGCKKVISNDSETTTNKTTTKNNKDDSVNKSQSEAERLQKYNGYTELNNFFMYTLNMHIDSYYKSFKYQEEFETKNSRIGGGYKIGDDYNEGLNSIFEYSKQGDDELDKIVKSMLPKVSQLIRNLNDMSAYMDCKEYINDDYAKAKELHKNIYKLSYDYYQLEEEFMSKLRVINNKINDQLLKEFYDNQYYARYYSLSVIVKAQKMEDYLKDNNFTGANILNLDLDVFKKEYYNPLNEEIENCLKYLNDQEELRNEKFYFISIENCEEAEAYRKEMIEMKETETEIIENIQKRTSFYENQLNYGSYSGNVDGSAESFFKEFGKVKKRYNNFKNQVRVN